MSQNIAKHNIIYHNMTQNSATYLSTAQHRKRSTIWREIAEDIGEQGWRSGESARLPPMCPEIPGPGVTCGLSLLVLYSAQRGFSPGTPVFPSPQNQHLI